ncbi:MAG TPA: BadF/BadG/BcrA/BcrD ATPase family protein [Candidatus Dormibacteraeota bacterium]|nr:BadF/BadG/BcrA/BcrD ATPase family protein [Candidatus Dormibacteraeota bacterium]
MKVVIGVDAGGSKTLAVAASGDGAHVGRAERGPANATSVGVEAAVATLREAVAEAAAGWEVEAICVGAAGASRRSVAYPMRKALVDAYPDVRVRIVDDAAIALRAAVPEGAGVVVISGTGSVGYAEDDAGSAHRAGGLGWLIGDEGSGYAVGLAALREAARTLDGRGAAQALLALVREHLSVADRDELLAAVYRRDGSHLEPAQIAALAAGVVHLAGEGDRPATKIVQSAALDLGGLAVSAARAAGIARSNPRVVLAGGLLREGTLLTYLLQTRIENDLLGAVVTRLAHDPVEGALTLARR